MGTGIERDSGGFSQRLRQQAIHRRQAARQFGKRGRLALVSSITGAFILVALLGFPVAVVMAWVFESTPEGMQFDPVRKGTKRIVGAAVVLVIGLLICDVYLSWHDGAFGVSGLEPLMAPLVIAVFCGVCGGYLRWSQRVRATFTAEG